MTYDYIGRSTEAIDYPEADTTQLFTYDDLGRIIECESVDVNDVAILDFEYLYDEVGNRKQCKYNHLATPIYDKYYYDSLRRLTKAEYAQTSGFALANDVLPLGNLVFVASAWLNDEVVDYANFEAYKDNTLLSQRLEQMEAVLEEAGYRNIEAFLNSVKGVQVVASNPDDPIYTFAVFPDDVPNNYTSESVTNDNGDVIALILWDNKDRMVLFAMYPDSGDTVVVSKSYDNQDNLTANTITMFDADGEVTYTEDMLAAEEVTLMASSLSASSMSMTTSSVVMSSEPEAPANETEEFKLDHLGNRYEFTQKNGFTYTYEHNSVNQYLSREANVMGITLSETYSHDDNGNLSVDENGNSYSYDYRNRLIEVEDSNSVTIAEYQFDALGRRISKTVGSETTYFFYNTAGRVIAEYDDSVTPALEREYVYGNGIDEVLAMLTPYHAGDPDDWTAFTEFIDAWLCQDPNDACYDSTYDHDNDDIVNFEDFSYFAGIWDIPSNEESDWYYLRDALGSTRGLVGGRFKRESDGEFWNYDVYGNLSIQDSEESKSGNAILFAGYYYDSETGLYRTVFRVYDSEKGRWLQFDPIGNADSMSLYEYALSSPTMYIDPWGLSSGYDGSYFGDYDIESQICGFFSSAMEFFFGGKTEVVEDVAYDDGTVKQVNSVQIQWFPPREGFGGATGGAMEESTLRLFDLLEPYPTAYSRNGMEFGACFVPVAGPASRLATGKTVTGCEASRLEAGAELALDCLACYTMVCEAADSYNDSRRVIKSTQGTTATSCSKGAKVPNPNCKSGVNVKCKVNGPYSHLKDHKSVGPGKRFTKTQKCKINEANRAANGGVLRDDDTGQLLVAGQKHQKGVTPPTNEAHVDHIVPKSKDGTNSYSNAKVISRERNLKKGNKVQ